jgi:2-alkyl-3-oxoalkanoate reductase
MRILVTGANGFVGEAVVRSAVAAGHKVEALVRPHSSNPFEDLSNHEGLNVLRADLRQTSELAAALLGIDAVIHLAAAKAGDFHTQFATTVVGTEGLLNAMQSAGVRRLVAVSSFSVYDYELIAKKSVLDESSPLVSRAYNRDNYSQTKRIQEDLSRSYTGPGREVVVVRPGMIYGPNELWHALLGGEFGRYFLRIGRTSELPMTFVDNVADALVAAAVVPGAAGQTINIVDDDLPTQDEYAKVVQRHITAPPHVTIPWPVMNGFTWSIRAVNNMLWSGKAKFPSVFVWNRMQARFKPLRYSNRRAKAVLGWSPKVSFEDAVRLSVEREKRLAAKRK